MHSDKRRPDDWAELGRDRWRRKKWRRTDGSYESEHCTACGIPIHRKSTYYLRPAYTNGAAWLCWRCHRTMRAALEQQAGNEYRHRRDV